MSTHTHGHTHTVKALACQIHPVKQEHGVQLGFVYVYVRAGEGLQPHEPNSVCMYVCVCLTAGPLCEQMPAVCPLLPL